MTAQMRKDRIERLLSELEYEIVRGCMEHEIEPDIHFRKVFPCIGRGDGMAQLEFHVFPAMNRDLSGITGHLAVKLRVIEGGKTDG